MGNTQKAQNSFWQQKHGEDRLLSDFLDSDVGQILVEVSEHSDGPSITGTDGTWRKFTKSLVKKTNEVQFLRPLQVRSFVWNMPANATDFRKLSASVARQ